MDLEFVIPEQFWGGAEGDIAAVEPWVSIVCAQLSLFLSLWSLAPEPSTELRLQACWLLPL